MVTQALIEELNTYHVHPLSPMIPIITMGSRINHYEY